MSEVYVGPYVQVPHQLWVKQTLVLSCSEGCSAVLSRTQRFCSQCGHPVVAKPGEVSERRPVDCGDPRLQNGKWTDELFTPRTGSGQNNSLWLPNKRGFGMFLREETSPDGPPFNPDAAWMAEQTAKLISAYQPLFDCYEAMFGEPVKILQGLVTYQL